MSFVLSIKRSFFAPACMAAAFVMSSCSGEGNPPAPSPTSAAPISAEQSTFSTTHVPDVSEAGDVKHAQARSPVLQLPQVGATEASAKRPVADYQARLDKLESIRKEVPVSLDPDVPPIHTLASEADIPGCRNVGRASFGQQRRDGGTNSVVTLFKCGNGQLLEISESDTLSDTHNTVSMSLPDKSINARVNEHDAVYRHLVDESGRNAEIVSWLQPGRRVSVQAVSESAPARSLLERAVAELAVISGRTDP